MAARKAELAEELGLMDEEEVPKAARGREGQRTPARGQR